MEHLRALAVIITLATVVFLLARSPACAKATASADFTRRRNLWLLIVGIAFLAHSFWLYIIVGAVALLFAGHSERNKLALYFLLLFAVPPISADIGGLGIIRSLFTIDYLRLLALTILAPTAWALWKDPESPRFGRLLPDKFIAAYLILIFALTLQASTLTHALRSGVLYGILDIFLPYYVASRYIKNTETFRDTLMSFLIAAMILAAIGCFEAFRHWLLYASLDSALGVNWAYGAYLERGDGVLRAQASTGHAIPLGYVMAVAIGFLLYLLNSLPNVKVKIVIFALLLAGIIAPISRGPWVGAAVIILVFISTAHSAAKKIKNLAVTGFVALPIILSSPYGEKLISYLPFIGTIDEENVDYRERLLEISINVVLQNPLFGAYDYMFSDAMQELRQGQGIIDIVNSYVAVALSSGLVGLSLYAGFFIVIGLNLYRSLRSIPDRTDERYILGQSLLATLAGILVIIFTVSSISVIPVIYWSVAGMCVAYSGMILRNAKTKPLECSTKKQQGNPKFAGTRPQIQPALTKK